jgi:hypothetical protein
MLFPGRALFGGRMWILGALVALVLWAFAAYRVHSGHLQVGTLTIVGVGFLALVVGVLRSGGGR